MTGFVALLRAVNLGGNTVLPSAELKSVGEACGFTNVRTFIASGNLLFESPLGEDEVTRTIEAKLDGLFGRHVPVFVRTGAEMAEVAAANPFADEAPNRTVAYFMAGPPSQAMIDAATGQKDERLALGKREIYIFYGEGMGKSKLKLPAFRDGTARNMNSVAKMAGLLA